MKTYRMYIDGEWTFSNSGEMFASDNPYTGKPWAMIPRGNAADVNSAVEAAARAMEAPEWRDMHPSTRGKLLVRLGDLIRENAQALAETEVRDNGKLMAEMQGQLRYLPEWYYYFGGLADKIEGSVPPSDKPGIFNYVRREPVGVVAAIGPWNSPLLLTTYKICPALAAGCSIVVKPSEFTSASMLEFAELVEKAGFPKGVFNVVTGFGAEVGAPLVEHPKVAKVAFTGSDMTGQRVYEAAARGLKKVTLELGGKSPNIVFADANLENACNGVIGGIFAAAGQTCIAGSRLLVQRQVHDEFVDRLRTHASTVRLGDPMRADTHVGPMSTMPQMDKVLSYFDVAKQDGAELIIGGRRASGPELGDGWFIEPTIYAGVNNNMRIAREEVFGPILSVIPFDDEEEALTIANDSDFGLAAGVWTQDAGRMFRMSDRLKAGMVWVNTYRVVSYLSPFGGFKRSGLGHENGKDAMNDYLQSKSVWINAGGATANPFVLG
ncbi:aldehyde dehydrogenase [Cupriavidus pinatubonensis]|uniref:aldehyde dehydrogenase n=1 Tax=Cupriavidus pinatubonensis TaxID=248026 RepID=UPI00112CC038|nr:aldehyde dehydrogenase [Cupriavidus pinatubonensis]TPQ28190.1 carnitine dehydratase [Cupriavidus pinatubonensis]